MTKLKNILAAEADLKTLADKFRNEVKNWTNLGTDDKDWKSKGKKINKKLNGILQEVLKSEGYKPTRFSFTIWPESADGKPGRDYWGLKDNENRGQMRDTEAQRSKDIIVLKIGTNGSETTSLQQALKSLLEEI